MLALPVATILLDKCEWSFMSCVEECISEEECGKRNLVELATFGKIWFVVCLF